jgi:hypothetical protein
MNTEKQINVSIDMPIRHWAQIMLEADENWIPGTPKQVNFVQSPQKLTEPERFAAKLHS